MKKFCLFAGICVLGCVAFPQRSPAPIVVRQGEGVTYTAPGSEEVPNEKDAQTQYDNALEKEKKGDLNSALGGYRKTVKRFPKSTVAPSAQYKIGQILERQKSYDGAATAYELLIKRYPHSTDFNAALEGEFRIATAYQEGLRQKLLGVPTLPSRDRAIAMYAIITANAPYSRYSPLAQFRIGQCLEVQTDYRSAINAYQKVADKYPNDPIAANALYQIAYCHMKIAQQGSNDKTSTLLARDGFEDFITAYPNSEMVPQAKANLDTLQTQQTGGSLEIANYYYKQAQYRAAVVYYNDVLRQQPDSADGNKAKARLDSIRKKYGDKYFADATPNAGAAGVNRAVTPKLGDGRLQAANDTSKRPDYVGPPISAPTPPPAPVGNLLNPPTGGSGPPLPPSSSPQPEATPLPVPEGEQPSLPAQ